MRRGVLAAAVAALLAAGCGPAGGGSSAKAPPIRQAEPDPWQLRIIDPRVESPAWLTNGRIGVRIGRDGTGFGSDGEPLGFFMIDAYEPTGEEKIRSLPNPLLVRLRVAGLTPNPASADEYAQTLNMKTGVLTTTWTQARFVFAVDTAIHPERRILAQRWTITPPVNATIDFQSVDVGEVTAEGLEQTMRLPDVATPARVRTVVAAGIEGKVRRIDGETVWSGRTGRNVPISVERTVTADSGEPLDYRAVQAASLAAWTERWKTDIEIDGPVEDQQAIRSHLFYLRSAIPAGETLPVSPMGLSSAIYFGHVFWDADVWVFPALALVDPAAAAAIPNYRLAREAGAAKNFRRWVDAGRPVAAGNLPARPVVGDPIMVPWESSVTGLETVPGPSRHQHHITGTAAFALGKAAALGIVPSADAARFVRRAGDFYRNRIEVADGVGQLKATMSPDEHFTGNNDLYTNLLAQWTLDGGSWRTPAGTPRMKLPRDSQSLLTYDGDPVRSYKQAAAVLAIYPLQFPEAEKQAKVMMDRFADKVIPNGPAMADSVHAVIWARLGERERAYEKWRKSWQEFAQPGLLNFSEKRRNDRSYFLTGAGGSLQSVIYGFMGFRIDSVRDPGAAWARKLNGDRWLTVRPNLPPAWKRITFRNFRVLGERHTLTVTPTEATVTSGD